MRITRSCKEANVIPHVGHFIEVLWQIHEKERNAENRREVWWRAKVNSLELSDRRDVIAIGVITYCKLEDFEPEAAQVEFLAGRKLRGTARSRVKGRRDQNGNGRFPELSWRTDAMKQNTMVEDSDGFNQRSSITSTSIGGPRDMYPTVGANLDSTLKPIMLEDIKRLRTSQAKLLLNVEQLKARMMVLENGSSDSRAEPPQVFKFLEQKMVHALETQPLGTSTKGIPKTGDLIDGVRTGVIRVRTDCKLEQYEAVAREVHLRSRVHEKEVILEPAFDHTQSPSSMTTRFDIRFSNVIALFECIGINSIDDRLSLLCRRQTTKHGVFMRVLGTYSYDPGDDKGPSNINMGGSLPTTLHDGNRRVPVKTTIPVLKRMSREWDMIDMMYTHPIMLINEEVAEAEHCGKKSTECFSLTWRRSNVSLKRKWSEEIRTTAHRIGSLELSIPYVVVTDSPTVAHLEELISDHNLEHFVSQRKIVE